MKPEKEGPNGHLGIKTDKEHLRSENFHEDKQVSLPNKTSIVNRVPPATVMFEEEGTQTENYNGGYFYGTPDDTVEDGGESTILNQVGGSRGQNSGTIINSAPSRLQENDSVSVSSSGTHHRGYSGNSNDTRLSFTKDDSTDNFSESGSATGRADSVIERLSKSVSRLLKPVRSISN